MQGTYMYRQDYILMFEQVSAWLLYLGVCWQQLKLYMTLKSFQVCSQLHEHECTTYMSQAGL